MKKSLKTLISQKQCLRILEAHSPLCAIIGDNINIKMDKKEIRYDGYWSSSLTDSTLLGKPDTEFISLQERLSKIFQIREVSNKPIIMDADTGGHPEHLKLHVETMKQIGVEAFVIEDKIGLKKNSLLGNDVKQTQDSIEGFSSKISLINSSKELSSPMLIARIESLILENGMEDAIKRAVAYVEAGCDGIMIHSRNHDCSDIFEFAKSFRSILQLCAISVRSNQLQPH